MTFERARGRPGRRQGRASGGRASVDRDPCRPDPTDRSRSRPWPAFGRSRRFAAGNRRFPGYASPGSSGNPSARGCVVPPTHRFAVQLAANTSPDCRLGRTPRDVVAGSSLHERERSPRAATGDHDVRGRPARPRDARAREPLRNGTARAGCARKSSHRLSALPSLLPQVMACLARPHRSWKTSRLRRCGHRVV